MTEQSFEAQIARVHAMAHDANGEAWELGGTDRAALLAVLASHRELLTACKECLAVTAAAMRVIAKLDAHTLIGDDMSTREQAFLDEVRLEGVANGFGVRAKAAIAKAEGR